MAGPSGRILDSLLDSIGLRRRDVYVTHIVKDYSPTGTWTPPIIELYAPFLERQLSIIQPHVLTTLGHFASRFLLKRFGLDDTGKTAALQMEYGPVHIFPLPHPAVALYNRHEMENLIAAFRQLAALLV